MKHSCLCILTTIRNIDWNSSLNQKSNSSHFVTLPAVNAVSSDPESIIQSSCGSFSILGCFLNCWKSFPCRFHVPLWNTKLSNHSEVSLRASFGEGTELNSIFIHLHKSAKVNSQRTSRSSCLYLHPRGCNRGFSTSNSSFGPRAIKLKFCFPTLSINWSNSVLTCAKCFK